MFNVMKEVLTSLSENKFVYLFWWEIWYSLSKLKTQFYLAHQFKSVILFHRNTVPAQVPATFTVALFTCCQTSRNYLNSCQQQKSQYHYGMFIQWSVIQPATKNNKLDLYEQTWKIAMKYICVGKKKKQKTEQYAQYDSNACNTQVCIYTVYLCMCMCIWYGYVCFGICRRDFMKTPKNC